MRNRIACERSDRLRRDRRFARPPFNDIGREIRTMRAGAPAANAIRRNPDDTGRAFCERQQLSRRHGAHARHGVRVHPQLNHVVVRVGEALFPRIISGRQIECLETFAGQMAREQQQLQLADRMLRVQRRMRDDPKMHGVVRDRADVRRCELTADRQHRNVQQFRMFGQREVKRALLRVCLKRTAVVRRALAQVVMRNDLVEPRVERLR